MGLGMPWVKQYPLKHNLQLKSQGNGLPTIEANTIGIRKGCPSNHVNHSYPGNLSTATQGNNIQKRKYPKKR